jgi:hypothetical protein
MADKSNAGGKPKPRLGTRLVWFVALWLGGVGAVAALALAIRQFL